MSDTTSKSTLGGTLYLIFSVCTAMIGYTIHKSVFWSIIDFIFTPLVWVKWLIYHEVTLDILRKTFDWFL